MAWIFRHIGIVAETVFVLWSWLGRRHEWNPFIGRPRCTVTSPIVFTAPCAQSSPHGFRIAVFATKGSTDDHQTPESVQKYFEQWCDRRSTSCRRCRDDTTILQKQFANIDDKKSLWTCYASSERSDGHIRWGRSSRTPFGTIDRAAQRTFARNYATAGTRRRNEWGNFFSPFRFSSARETFLFGRHLRTDQPECCSAVSNEPRNEWSEVKTIL